MPPVLFPALLLFELELARFLGLMLLPRPELVLQLALFLLELCLGADAGPAGAVHAVLQREHRDRVPLRYCFYDSQHLLGAAGGRYPRFGFISEFPAIRHGMVTMNYHACLHPF